MVPPLRVVRKVNCSRILFAACSLPARSRISYLIHVRYLFQNAALGKGNPAPGRQAGSAPARLRSWFVRWRSSPPPLSRSMHTIARQRARAPHTRRTRRTPSSRAHPSTAPPSSSRPRRSSARPLRRDRVGSSLYTIRSTRLCSCRLRVARLDGRRALVARRDSAVMRTVPHVFDQNDASPDAADADSGAARRQHAKQPPDCGRERRAGEPAHS